MRTSRSGGLAPSKCGCTVGPDRDLSGRLDIPSPTPKISRLRRHRAEARPRQPEITLASLLERHDLPAHVGHEGHQRKQNASADRQIGRVAVRQVKHDRAAHNDH
jgi:hypothetical protein